MGKRALGKCSAGMLPVLHEQSVGSSFVKVSGLPRPGLVRAALAGQESRAQMGTKSGKLLSL
jgi:hypothetical protein